MQDKAAIRSRKKNLREEIHCAITPSERTVDNKKMDNHSFEKISIEDLGQALVESIVYYGIKYWFVNVGSDWPPFMDAIAKRWAQKNEYPKFIICPHEFTATSMAHGYAMVSHDIPLVGYHTTVGTYNALGAIMNAYTARVPLFLLAGGGWITKEGLERIAEVPISQESRDQANPLREFIKWDCEIRLKEHIPKVVQRAIQISQTEPKGPVYISIPNDVALEKATEILLPPRELFVPPSPPQGKPTAIHSAAKLLVQAKYPLIVTREMGRNPAAVNRLIKLAELLAIPVSGALGKLGYMNFPTNHPLSASIPVEEADVVLVIEDHSPWKGECIPNPQAKYINLAVDPLYAHLYSITSHCPADIFITADPATALAHLYSIAHRLVSDDKAKQREIGERFEQIKKIHIKEVEAKKEEAIAFKDKKPIERSWINYCIGQVKGETDILINDYGYTFQGTGDFIIPGTFFSTPPSACLGWGLGAALGAKLAAPENTIIACMGDGGYIYGNPLAAHFTSRKYNLPFLTVIYNNQGWGDPHKALLKEYPNGWAVKYGYLGTFNSLSPSLDFELICKSANGYAETVEDPHEVRPALERALTAVKKEKRQALLNFIINPIG